MYTPRITTRLATEEEKLLNEDAIRVPPPKSATQKELLQPYEKPLAPKSNFSRIAPEDVKDQRKVSVSSIGSDLLKELGLDEEEFKV